MADAGLEDMERAIAAARRAFDETDWSTDHTFRLHCLEQLKAGLAKHMPELKLQIAAETGAPMGICGETGPQCEIPIGFMDYTLKHLPTFQWSRDIGTYEIMGGSSRRGGRVGTAARAAGAGGGALAFLTADGSY